MPPIPEYHQPDPYQLTSQYSRRQQQQLQQMSQPHMSQPQQMSQQPFQQQQYQQMRLPQMHAAQRSNPLLSQPQPVFASQPLDTSLRQDFNATSPEEAFNAGQQSRSMAATKETSGAAEIVSVSRLM